MRHTSRHVPLPGRDRRAVRHPAPDGAGRPCSARHVLVVGGGIAGLAAATILSERGVRVSEFLDDGPKRHDPCTPPPKMEH